MKTKTDKQNMSNPETPRCLGCDVGQVKTIVAVVVGTAVYATVRYNLFKGVDWTEWPVYVLNKVFALSALILLMLHIVRSRRGPGQAGAGLQIAAWMLMLMHAGVSLAILTPTYYVKDFQGDKLTWQAAWSMMLGVVAAALLHLYSRACERNGGQGLIVKLGWLAFASGAHAMLFGYDGWFTPAKWPGHMIPITLLSFLTGIVALAAALWPKRLSVPR